ncbi:MAG TPA: hypothetical protein PKB10_04345 [Tepidisphaeraceae bacterium]|nr:hypothetical protein [Tepidisphaeraceae bacterium]
MRRATRPARPIRPTCPATVVADVIAAPAAPVARGFASAVRGSLQGGVLSYDDRDRLLARASRLGLTRFDALLIIAAVQHGQASTPSPATGMSRSRDRWLIGTAVLGVQAAIVGAAAWLLMG